MQWCWTCATCATRSRLVQRERLRWVARCERPLGDIAVDHRPGGDLASCTDAYVRCHCGMRSEKDARCQAAAAVGDGVGRKHAESADASIVARGRVEVQEHVVDRKSTRLNSSHRTISYAVFCLKKKKKIC